MPTLIPTAENVMQLLKTTNAFREGHFVYPSGKHTAHYFQMPLAFRYYDSARVLAVGLSRTFRLDKEIASMLPNLSIISPSSGGIPVAFGVREALSAQQIYWAEREDGKRMFRQYVIQGDVKPCIIVDDIIRSGNAMRETIDLVKDLGIPILGFGAIVRFTSAPSSFDGIPVKSLVEFESTLYDSTEACIECRKDAPEEHVRF